MPRRHWTCIGWTIGLTLGIGQAELFADLIGYWKLDEGIGVTAHDSSPSARSATIQGNPSWIPWGESGTALIFDSKDAYVDYIPIAATASIHLKSAFTISAWVWQTQPMTEMALVSKHAAGSENGWFLSLKNGYANFFVNSEAGRLTGGPMIADEKWHHVMGVYDGQNQWLYVDGKAVATGQTAYTKTNTQPWIIGGVKLLDNSYLGYIGCIDEVQIFNQAMPDHAAAFLYANPYRSVPEPMAISWLLLGSMTLIAKRRTGHR